MNVMSKYLTEAEQKALLCQIRQSSGLYAQRDHAWIAFLRDTGLRIAEFHLTDVGDAKFWLKAGRGFIPKERRKGKRADFDFYLGAAAREHLTRLIEIHARLRGLQVDDLEKDAPLVLSRHGDRMSVRSYQARLGMWAERAGLGHKVSPHWLRHTRAMNIMRRSTSKDPRGIVQVALGHADIRSTGIYTRPSREEVERQLQIVEGRRLAKRSDLRKLYELEVRA